MTLKLTNYEAIFGPIDKWPKTLQSMFELQAGAHFGHDIPHPTLAAGYEVPVGLSTDKVKDLQRWAHTIVKAFNEQDAKNFSDQTEAIQRWASARGGRLGFMRDSRGEKVWAEVITKALEGAKKDAWCMDAMANMKETFGEDAEIGEDFKQVV